MLKCTNALACTFTFRVTIAGIKQQVVGWCPGQLAEILITVQLVIWNLTISVRAVLTLDRRVIVRRIKIELFLDDGPANTGNDPILVLIEIFYALAGC